MPVRVIMASPRSVCAPNDSATPLSGWPSKRSRKISDQATVNPQLAGRSGEIATPFAASVSTHPPSDPSRGQLAPPSASTVACASTTRVSIGRRRTTSRPSSSQPVQRWRSANCTPIASSRRSHARSNGEALNASGKPGRWSRRRSAAPAPRSIRATRPAETPSIAAASCGIAVAVAREKCRQRFAVREIEPAAPGHQKLAAHRWHRVIDRDAERRLAPALRPPSARPDRRR